jgi:photosystem II stability/assembly factor-like uncharacterized protein
MKRLIILFIAVLISTLAIAQGWEQQVSPTANDLTAVVFVDTSNGWAVGGYFATGTILHTTDGGALWTIQTAEAPYRLAGVDFVDASHGWAVGGAYGLASGGVTMRTTDGATWTISDSLSPNVLLDVDFVDVDHGWAVGSGWYEFGCLYIIRHTTDGGTTWTTQDSGFGSYYSGVKFVDANNGWVIGTHYTDTTPTPIIIHTTNGGETWVPQDSLQCFPSLLDIGFVDSNSGWVVGSRDCLEGRDFVAHTTDGGSTWMWQLDPLYYVVTPLSSVDFVDQMSGWVLGGCCFGIPPDDRTLTVIKHTTDGGETWTPKLYVTAEGCHPEMILACLDFVDMNHGWAVGNSGMILKYNPTLQAPDEHSNLKPASFGLSTFPNPFNPSTTITYNLPRTGHVSLRVFDLLGREVAVLKEGFMEVGSHHVMFDGSSLASGVYFARLDAGRFSQTKKLMLLK